MPDYGQLVDYMVKKIVTEPDSVAVEVAHEGHRAVVRVTASPQDLGKVIGRKGRHIEAIRMVVRAASLRSRDRVQVEVRD
jgi:predicted RNA-binding protein YlqC (UPF0109 family)